MPDANTTTETPAGSPPSLVCAIVGDETKNNEDGTIDDETLRNALNSFLDRLGAREDVFLLPPDYTRFHSKAGKITRMIAEYYKRIPGDCGDKDAAAAATSPFPPPSEFKIMPALGTHAPMTGEQIEKMYGNELGKLNNNNNNGDGGDDNPFMVHDWRNDVTTIGHVPNEMVKTATNGMVDEPWPAQLNKAVWEKRKQEPGHGSRSRPHPLVVSIGQVVPHEVMGMANFNKNLFVGVGGLEAINLSHFIGAVYGMEKMMGRADNPLRAILNHASEEFLQNNLDLWYVLTVVAPDGGLRGVFIGNTIECYQRACELSMAVNFTMLEESPKTMVVYLDPDEFHSTWLGNKAIYRTRLAIADGGELIVLAPGVRKFGEDDAVDGLIRKYGYYGTPRIMGFLRDEDERGASSGGTAGELRNNLGALAHLIHGSTEGRFSVTYCTDPNNLSKEEIEGVGFDHAHLDEAMEKYDPGSLADGWNKSDDGEDFFFIRNPALGLWAVPSRFG
mmetsp:Transcript_8082/g.16752  ORF Transcript_8082/g.16752 Transcript_8082/m.16752 type:complete len:503 (+) Transcript_8082:201-1709(+)|eukprot:CAMPEP_0201127692 /NCGR_PEP_ID=MMETSP0850-20130426/31118_1 /ASSEMBLY_ACC=CAM_ASM_000622 /TAXON_ID=183588 /ORGANISM="Pseudo-nitzschia fraudulenta, Strain WWA7" /LENGTH=502 /DNA_ID=CAMNT_0047396609 /DNA_START=165 /DNA_END=1673 /DNA_ORIENTATION=-